MPPRRRGRGRGQFPDESGGQNEDQHSFPSRGRGRRVEEEVDDLTTRVESMEIVMDRCCGSAVLVVRCRVEMSGSAVRSVSSDRIQMSSTVALR
ncbi:hypothetical protein F511_22126 [Dorcoceras hygrometricum]|uniref:Uncharacterized protein n=1 Tax=Dorcoceras hygrometricum TaxID=472368 RepID=A0A2Z7CKK9_9LAMI|nr:hypothetical protein F511_22126 [Dorcoceras hygrometricum]